MGSNPMQKMKRSAMITGAVIGLAMGLILCVIIYIFLSKSGTNLVGSKDNLTKVYVLNKAVKSGETVTTSDISVKTISAIDAPASDLIYISSSAIAKIDLSAGTILTAGMLNTSAENITNDLREQEYNMILLPTYLQVGDFIDIRLQLLNGGDYIVIAKKKVIKCNQTTVWLNLNEEEIEVLSNAIVEYYTVKGSKLYASKYTDPGIQEEATPTYCPNAAVTSLISNNPNITSLVRDGEGRFSEKLKSIRNTNINSTLNQYSDVAAENVESKIQTEISNSKKSRDAYFESLNTGK